MSEVGVFLSWLFFWLFFSFVSAFVAGKKGRSFEGILVLSLVFSPLIGLIVALVMQPNVKALEGEKIATGQSKKCPFCAEVIKSEAIVCRFCGKDQPVLVEKIKTSVESEKIDEVAFENWKRDRISADKATFFLFREGLENFKDEDWWKRVYRLHLKNKDTN